MKILVVSDTHRSLANFETVYNRVKPVDAVLHLGDVEGQEELVRSIAECPVHFVKGNCDLGSPEPIARELSLGGVKIFMTHGHKYGINWGTEGLEEMGWQTEAKVVLYGHTHRPVVEWKSGFWLCNPGSITQPRQEDRRPSYIILETDRRGDILPGINYLD